MESRYLLTIVAIVALLSLSMMFSQAGKSPVGQGAATVSQSTMERIDTCTNDHMEEAGGDQGKAARYCECVVLYSGRNECLKYLAAE
ncbi:MAG: hypothetical protein Q7R76_03830 [Candidatus Woesearchaeota archaeon]|nr:hypothetical protein [Candidatus Woesearchaeota archaeon]